MPHHWAAGIARIGDQGKGPALTRLLELGEVVIRSRGCVLGRGRTLAISRKTRCEEIDCMDLFHRVTAEGRADVMD